MGISHAFCTGFGVRKIMPRAKPPTTSLGFSFQCSVLIGLIYQEELLGDRSTPSRSKARRTLLWLSIPTIWVFFTMIWLFSSSDMDWMLKFV